MWLALIVAAAALGWWWWRKRSGLPLFPAAGAGWGNPYGNYPASVAATPPGGLPPVPPASLADVITDKVGDVITDKAVEVCIQKGGDKALCALGAPVVDKIADKVVDWAWDGTKWVGRKAKAGLKAIIPGW